MEKRGEILTQVCWKLWNEQITNIWSERSDAKTRDKREEEEEEEKVCYFFHNRYFLCMILNPEIFAFSTNNIPLFLC